MIKSFSVVMTCRYVYHKFSLSLRKIIDSLTYMVTRFNCYVLVLEFRSALWPYLPVVALLPRGKSALRSSKAALLQFLCGRQIHLEGRLFSADLLFESILSLFLSTRGFSAPVARLVKSPSAAIS